MQFGDKATTEIWRGLRIKKEWTTMGGIRSEMKIAICASEDFSLGVGYLMAFLKEQGHDVRLFFDPRQYARGYSHNKRLARFFSVEDYNVKQIKEFNPEMCLFSCLTANYQWALGMARKVKERVGCKIVFGGVHPTLVPDEVKKNDFIDEVVIGDGIAYFGGKFSPDKLFPDRQAFYRELPPIHHTHPIFMASFGCPYNCSFCGNEQLRKTEHYRFFRRSPEGCIKELQELKANGAKYIIFADDIFTSDRKWLLNFLANYEREIGLPFAIFGHPKYLQGDVVKRLKEAGCHTVWIGIQTGMEQLRKDVLSRRETNGEIVAACRLIKQAGMKLIIDHIFGIPFEQNMTQDISYGLYKDCKPDIVNCYQLLYFPKAKIIEHALRCGYLNTADIPKIERGEGLVHQQDNRPQKFRDTYMKALTVIPLGSVVWELCPTWLAKVIIYFRAGRWFIPLVIIQNELFFTWRWLLKVVIRN